MLKGSPSSARKLCTLFSLSALCCGCCTFLLCIWGIVIFFETHASCEVGNNRTADIELEQVCDSPGMYWFIIILDLALAFLYISSGILGWLLRSSKS